MESDCEWDISPKDGQCLYKCLHCKQDAMTFQCGVKLRRNCTNTEAALKRRELKLGDVAEKLLNHLGITQERYIETKAWLLGLPASEVSCGCPDRKDWLNKLGDKFLRLVGR